MPKKYESLSPTEAPEISESRPQTNEKVRSPEDEQALGLRRHAGKLIDKYEIQRSKYELALLSQKQSGPPTAEQIELKTELKQIWDELHSMIPDLTEAEYMAEDTGVKNSLNSARKEISALSRYTGQESSPEETSKKAYKRVTESQMDNRESSKLNAQEKLRSKDQIKKLRVKLAKLKSAFAGAYKMSPARAEILLSQPTGFLGALKSLTEGTRPTNEERKKLGAIRGKDAEDLLKNIKDLETTIEKEWKKAKKEAVMADLDNANDIEEAALDDTVSVKTLRESYNLEIEAAKAEGDNKRASEILDELNRLKASLTEYFPELIRDGEAPEAQSERLTIIPPEPVDLETADTLKRSKFTPPTARNIRHEKQIIIPEEKAKREAPTLRGINEIGERQIRINNSLDAFGGGEAGRKYAADLWDHANKMIQEKGSISLQGEKGRFVDALDYVNAFAKNTKLSAEILGQKRSAEIWQEIYDHKNELLKSPSLDEAEKAKLEALDPIYYVTQSALRDKALQNKDLDATGKHNANIDEINKLLGYPEGMNPSTGEGMGTSPRKETRGLGKNRARSEMSRMAEKASGISSRSYEANVIRKQERIAEPAYTIEWASQLMPNAKAEWDNVSKLINSNSVKARKTVNEEIKNITGRIKEMLEAGGEISDEYHGINKIKSLRIGSPAEATRYVMLKALSELAPQKNEDISVQQALVDSVAEIDRKLTDLQGPSVEISETELTPSVRKAVQDEGVEVEVRDATDNESYIAREAAELATVADRLDKITEKEISNITEKIIAELDKKQPIPKDFNHFVKNELRKFHKALADGDLQTANESLTRLDKLLRDKIPQKKINAIAKPLKQATKDLLKAA